MTHPTIIQGGMGVAVSSWQLAQAVAQEGQLGVVSGTGIGIVMLARLQQGDPGGHIRRALRAFPYPDIAEKYIDAYFVAGGIPADQPYARPPLWTIKPSHDLNELTVVANFVEVWLAKDGHAGVVGINLLEKVQLPNLASIYGAMLADVDYVIMGAGIPMQVPGVLDAFAEHQAASYRVDVQGAELDDDYRVHFDPEQVFPGITERVGNLKRPFFLPIVSSVVLALALRKRANGEVNGFIIEMPIAGGHNAPPRGEMQLDENGDPIYGKKDDVKIEKFQTFGLPFWLAGGYGHPEKLQDALALGAAGIQVGTAFAYADESGFAPELRQRVIAQVLEDEAVVRTSPTASPTGFPFKVVGVPNSMSDPTVYAARERICDVGYLRHLYKNSKGKIGYRCPAEPVDIYVRKGGKVEDTVGRTCLCNNLGAAAGLPQVRADGYIEPPIVTSGDDLPQIKRFIPDGQTHYSARDVIRVLLGSAERV